MTASLRPRLLVGALFLCVLAPVVPQDSLREAPPGALWYRADRLGNAAERVSAESAASLAHALERFTEGTTRVERLYAEGVLLEERRSGGDVDELRVYHPDGSLDYTEHLFVYPDGSPREVRRRTEESLRIYRYRRTTGLPFEEWFEHGEERRVWRFGSAGALSERVVWDGEEMILREQSTYSDEGALVETLREDLEAGEELLRRFDDGLLVREERRRSGSLVATTNYSYGAQERLLREERQTPDGSVVIEYEYDEEGRLASVRHLRNGAVTLVLRYTDDGRVEDRYRNGSLVLRSYFRGEDRIREELYRNGRLIDVRGTE